VVLVFGSVLFIDAYKMTVRMKNQRKKLMVMGIPLELNFKFCTGLGGVRGGWILAVRPTWN
jgi:hypothetical protein